MRHRQPLQVFAFAWLLLIPAGNRAVASPTVLPPGTYRILLDQSQVGFTALKWSMFAIEGLFRHHRGEFVYDARDSARSRVAWEVDAASVSTGNDDRDKALRSSSFLDAERYPTLRFVSSSVHLAADGTFDVDGVLSIRGVARDVHSKVRVLGAQDVPGEGFIAGLATEFTIDRRDFGVLGGSLSRQMIANEVKIHLSAGARRER